MIIEHDSRDAPATAEPAGPAQVVLAYHCRTMHRSDGFARGPETLDWDAQPSPWRTWHGITQLRLPLVSDGVNAPYAALTGQATVLPAPLTLVSLAALLELSFGLSAWKEVGPDRWALRCNPSSGNLHPIEAYVLVRDVPGVPDGLHHYDSQNHALAHRCGTTYSGGQLWIGLSSIQWREAWKYGERAFRYCQLDIGHALGALEAAAAVLGWRLRILDHVHSETIARLLGTDREADFADAEAEEPEMLLAIDTGPGAETCLPVMGSPGLWQGTADRLDPHPIYSWPVIAEVAAATRGNATGAPEPSRAGPPTKLAPAARAAAIILGRRSAQRYDRNYAMPLDCLARALEVCRPEAESHLDLILFLHSVEGMEPGLYALPRNAPDAEAGLKAALAPGFLWEAIDALPTELPLRLLVRADSRKAIRAYTCHQAIAADACLTFSLLGDFAPLVEANPWAYRALHREAGRLGQRLYLEAEAAGLSGTGIGCFLDDEVHRLIGVANADRQVLYHFAIGRGLFDSRIASRPAYEGRTRSEAPVWPNTTGP